MSQSQPSFPCPTIEGMRSCDATHQSPRFISSCFFTCLESFNMVWMHLDFSGQHRPDKEQLNTFTKIPRKSYWFKDWVFLHGKLGMMFVHFESLLHYYEFTRSTYGDPSDTNHGVSQTKISAHEHFRNNNNDNIQKNTKTISCNGLNKMAAWTKCLHPEGLQISFWSLLVPPFACMKQRSTAGLQVFNFTTPLLLQRLGVLNIP